MQLFINIIISSIVQFILLSIIPFIWWLITARKENTFFQWIGYKKPHTSDRKRFWFIIIIIEIVFLSAFVVIIPLVYDNASLATSQFNGKGISAFIPALIYAFFQTSFNEELFFRGFLGKRLIKKFGFAFGNTLQGVIFGSMHGIMLYSSAGLLKAVIISVLTGAIGICMGYVCEKQVEGSLIPGWLMHGTFNTLSSLSVMFL